MLKCFLGFNLYKIKQFIIKANNGYWANLIMYIQKEFGFQQNKLRAHFLFKCNYNYIEYHVLQENFAALIYFYSKLIFRIFYSQ